LRRRTGDRNGDGGGRGRDVCRLVGVGGERLCAAEGWRGFEVEVVVTMARMAASTTAGSVSVVIVVVVVTLMVERGGLRR
jgi:hypothetical protein